MRLKELQRFPRLHAQLIETVSELLRERLGPTSDYAQSLIAIQAAYINTNHPDFVTGTSAAAKQAEPSRKRIDVQKRVSDIYFLHDHSLTHASGSIRKS